MKQFFLGLTLLLTLSSSSFGKEVKVAVKGMVCGFCAQGITKKLKAEPSVAKVDVSLEKKLVTIDLKDNQELTNSKIESILKDAGYNVEKIERK